MNKTPNPNYPLPEKWYVQRTKENVDKVNRLCSKILDVQLHWNIVGGGHFTPYVHSNFSRSETKCFKEPQEDYTEVTYEDLWLSYMIPEKWYCVDAPKTLLNRWRRLNGVTDLRANYKPITLSTHRLNNSYFWSSSLSDLKKTNYYDDYKEISLEDFTTLLDILEQNKNTKPMENNTPTEVIIPIAEFTKIVKVAGPAWQKKLRDYMIDNLQNDCFSIKITKDFYDQMIAASSVRNFISQADVINSVLPMFKHDPYQVFKDAEKEGKIVQCKYLEGSWVDRSLLESTCSYKCPPENYRIKHKHQDLIDEWEASGRTKVVQWLSVTDTWKEVLDNNPSWLEDTEYRFKPEPEYVPFDDSEIRQLMGEWIKHKVTGEMIMITEVYPPSHGGGITVKVVGGRTSLYVIFDQYTFLDGSPCGKPVQK